MKFNEVLNRYLKELDCTAKKLSIESGLSESVISRYRNGERTPKANSKQLKSISNALETMVKEKNIVELKDIKIYDELEKVILNKDSFDYDSFSKNFNELIVSLKININEMAKNIVFDSSHISRIRYGKNKPADPITFSDKVTKFIVNKYNDDDSFKCLSLLTRKNIEQENLYETIFNYLTNNTDNPSIKKDYINDFLTNLNDFDLNTYIKAIKFDELKVPNIPFYKAKTRSYYGLEEMKQGELDFFKATVLSKSNEDIFMCSDMPMEDMAKDIEFGKKWMFGIAMSLKKGLHLNIIHNIDRPFNEMMLGLESWIPIYMTGQVSPFYFSDLKNTVYEHSNYVSGNYALTGECIKSFHEDGKYYLTSNSKEVSYYKHKASLLLKKASPLMEIFNEKEKNLYQIFLHNDKNMKVNRRRILNSLPLFTIDNKLLDKILKENNISEEDSKIIKEYKKEEENNIKEILKTNTITDILYDYKEEYNQDTEIYLSLENIFYNKKIKYSLDDYISHLNSTLKYKNSNYKVIINNNRTFKNISVTSLENNYVIISKNSNPIIHFVIRHEKLTSAINNFNPLIKDN